MLYEEHKYEIYRVRLDTTTKNMLNISEACLNILFEFACYFASRVNHNISQAGLKHTNLNVDSFLICFIVFSVKLVTFYIILKYLYFYNRIRLFSCTN